MTALRARAVELVGEAFSGGSEDPTALQLQADELYGMEEVRSHICLSLLCFQDYSYETKLKKRFWDRYAYLFPTKV